MQSLTALTPLDGRYRADVEDLATSYFSEHALMRARILVEVEWLIEQGSVQAIAHLQPLSEDVITSLRAIMNDFTPADAERVKAIEDITQHDVKAVEYFLAERLQTLRLEHLRPYVHFACTSEDINNLAYGMLLRDALAELWLPAAQRLTCSVADLARATRGEALLALTHGQPATPTTLGKELAVFIARWEDVLRRLHAVRLTGKFNGATGTYGAHTVAYPQAPWPSISRAFVERLGLEWTPLTTQIEPHDRIVEVLHSVAHFNAILIDFCADVWGYISRGVLAQRQAAGAVGSSAMPHKVNPIRFENAEANAGLSIAVCEHLAHSLPISRMQRDLADSSRMRNVGVALGYSLVAIRSATVGMRALAAHRQQMQAELRDATEVLAEPVQTVLRKHGVGDAYERLATLVRDGVTLAELRTFVATAEVPEEDRRRLLELEPDTYTGLAASLAESACEPGRRASLRPRDLREDELVMQ